MGANTSKSIVLCEDIILNIIEYNPLPWCRVCKLYNHISIDIIMMLRTTRNMWESGYILRYAIRNNNYEVLNRFLSSGYSIPNNIVYNLGLVSKLLEYELEVPISYIIQYANTLDYRSAQYISICKRLGIWFVPRRK